MRGRCTVPPEGAACGCNRNAGVRAISLASRAWRPRNDGVSLEPHIEKLLVLQDRDIRRDEIVRHLAQIPLEVTSFRSRIEAEKQRLADAREAVRTIELKRRDVEQRIAKAEDQIVRFRTQQLSVKKNEEYTALEKEIEGALHAVSVLESEALEAMMEIDDAASAVKSIDAETRVSIAEMEGHIKRLLDNETHYKEQLADADAAVERAQADVSPQALGVYRYVKERVKRPPYVAPVDEQRCSGCHIKVSHTVMASLRVAGEISRCENCYRIVYTG